MLKILIKSFFLLLRIQCYATAQGTDAEEGQENQENNGTMKRYVIEPQYAPPIFGSFKYDAILQQFDLPSEMHSTTTCKAIHNSHEPTTNPKAVSPGFLRAFGNPNSLHTDQVVGMKAMAKTVGKSASTASTIAEPNKLEDNIQLITTNKDSEDLLKLVTDKESDENENLKIVSDKESEENDNLPLVTTNKSSGEDGRFNIMTTHKKYEDVGKFKLIAENKTTRESKINNITEKTSFKNVSFRTN